MKDTSGMMEGTPIQHETLAKAMAKHGAGHKPHAEHFKQHAAGHMMHDDAVEKMCSGGMAKGK